MKTTFRVLAFVFSIGLAIWGVTVYFQSQRIPNRMLIMSVMLGLYAGTGRTHARELDSSMSKMDYLLAGVVVITCLALAIWFRK